MLPSELLVVWKRKGEILPRYAKITSDNMEVADGIIEAYKAHVGEKKKILKAYVSDLEDKGYEYRFIRGLTFMLDRRSAFLCTSKVNPVELRRKIFQETETVGLPTTAEKRRRILASVASDLGLTLDTVEESLYADLDSELILEKFVPMPASELLGRYNLSLTQTLLFDSTELKFTVPGNWQRIFYTIKKLGLIYEVYRENGFWVKIDGPASLFKLTRRYGTCIAKLLPVIIANPEWTVEAKILWKYTNEICDLRIESRKHGSVLKKPDLPPVSYDSTIEENFASGFQALKSNWTLRREPEPIPVDKQVIIPDFSLERDGIKVYVEIVGFWTEEYLLRKIEKLKKIEAKMLLLINETLACEKLATLEKRSQINMIYYHDKIPLAPIIRYLEEAFTEVKMKQIEFLKNLPVTFTEPVVTFEEFGARIGISTEAARAVLAVNPPKGYVVLPNSLVSKDKLEQIRKQLVERTSHSEKLLLPEATKIVEAEGLPDPTSILDAVGSKITWHGISAERAEVSRPQDERP